MDPTVFASYGLDELFDRLDALEARIAALDGELTEWTARTRKLAETVAQMATLLTPVTPPQGTPAADVTVNAALHIEIVPDTGGYFASVVEWPGCMTQADTLPDLFAMLLDAMAAWQSVAVTQATPPAAMPSPTQAFDTLRAQFGRHFANWQPPEPDPIRHLIPPLDQWPEDAVAWMVEKDGCTVYLLPDVDGAAWETREAWTDDGSHPIFVTLPRGYDWRASLRLRPQTGA